MVTITAKFDNMDEVERALREIGARAKPEIGEAVEAHAVDVWSDIRRRIQRGPKTGRVYTTEFWTDASGQVRPGRERVPHQASAPGEAPAADRGGLASSIIHRKTGPLTAEIESRLPYAAMLEFGTSRMDPRPSWTPSVEAKNPDFIRRVSDAISRAAR